MKTDVIPKTWEDQLFKRLDALLTYHAVIVNFLYLLPQLSSIILQSQRLLKHS